MIRFLQPHTHIRQNERVSCVQRERIATPDIFGDEELVHPLGIPDFFHRLSSREEHGKHGHDRFASISIENDSYREMRDYSDI